MNQEKDQPNFFSILIAPVRYHKQLCDGAKLLYSEISALTQKEGYCWSQNQYFMDCFDKSRRTIQEWLSQLENLGFIKIYFDCPVIQSNRKITLCDDFKKFLPAQKTAWGGAENCTHNNIPNISPKYTYNTTLPPQPKKRIKKVEGKVVFPTENKNKNMQSENESLPINPILEKVRISENSKKRLTEQYSTEILKKVLYHVDHPKFVVKNSYEGSIFYFAQQASQGNPLEPTKEMREHNKIKEFERKEQAKMHWKFKSNELRKVIHAWAVEKGFKWYDYAPSVENEYIEFKNNRTGVCDKIYYDNVAFKEQCRNAMKKNEIDVPEDWK